MVYDSDGAECKITKIQSKEAAHLSFHGGRDMGKVAERYLCTKKMEGTDLTRGDGQNGEDCWRAEPQKKLWAMFLSFQQGKDQQSFLRNTQDEETDGLHQIITLNQWGGSDSGVENPPFNRKTRPGPNPT